MRMKIHCNTEARMREIASALYGYEGDVTDSEIRKPVSPMGKNAGRREARLWKGSDFEATLDYDDLTIHYIGDESRLRKALRTY